MPKQDLACGVGNLMANKVNGISISGDGVAIGTGNTVVVQKNRITNNHNNGNGRKNGGGRSGTEEHNPFAYAIVAIIALIVATYCFAKYANQFFIGAFIVSGLVTTLPLVSLGIQVINNDSIEHLWQESGTLTLSGILTWFIQNTWQNYPEKLGEIVSQSNSPHVFWCSLSAYGESVSSQNLIAAIGLVISILLLLPHSIRSASQHFFDTDSSLQEWLNEASSNGKLIGTAIIIGLTWAMLNFANPQVQSFMTNIRPLICHGN